MKNTMTTESASIVYDGLTTALRTIVAIHDRRRTAQGMNTIFDLHTRLMKIRQEHFTKIMLSPGVYYKG